MSSDSQFTAKGAAIVGFQTNPTDGRIDRGAEIAGFELGIKGSCSGPNGDGVQGFGAGHFSGVAGTGHQASDTEAAGTGVIGLGGLVAPGDLDGSHGGPGVRGIGGGGPNIGPPGTHNAVGVFGQGGPNSPGVVGQAGSGIADGVQGTGTGNFSGVVGFGGPDNGAGVLGLGGGLGPGVRGTGPKATNEKAPGGTGVLGEGGDGFGSGEGGVGVVGRGGKGHADGVQGTGTGTFSGVVGSGGDGAGTGVLGFGGGVGGTGVRGIGSGGPNSVPPVSAPVGVFGQGGADRAGSPVIGVGVMGMTDINVGVWGQSRQGGVGVFGEVQGSGGLAGFFQGSVEITGSLKVDGDLNVVGAKSAVVPFPDGSHRRMYSVESPESWFEDFGTGQLTNGNAEIRLADDFAVVANTDTYHVFLTEYDDNNALYLTERTSRGFTVRAKSSKTAHSNFSYRVLAKRKDIKGPRLERVTLTDDPMKGLKMGTKSSD